MSAANEATRLNGAAQSVPTARGYPEVYFLPTKGMIIFQNLPHTRIAIYYPHMLERRIAHTKLFNGETRTYHAYRVDEVPPDVSYEYWKKQHYDGPRINGGEIVHVLSDDGMVVPIFHVAYIRSGIVLRGPWGVFLLPRTHTNKAYMRVLGENVAQVEDYFSYKRVPNALLRGVVTRLAAHGLDVNEILSFTCVDPSGCKAMRIKKFLRSEECHRMIREEVRQILNNCGMTEEKVIKMLLDAHDVAKLKNDAANMLRAAENLVDMYGLKDKMKETTTQTLEIGSEVEDLQRLESVKERLKLQQKTENEAT